MTDADPKVSRETEGDDWNPDGLELARALVARAKAGARAGAAPLGSRSPRPSSSRRVAGGRRRWSGAPGAGWSGPAGDDRDPQPLGSTVDRLVGEHGWGEDIAVHGVIARWDEMVGPDIASHVRPDRYDNGVLTVRADSTAWATQVRMLAADIVKRLNREIGDGTVRSVTVLAPDAPSWSKGRRRVAGRGPRDTYG
jgi:predicted nucleic acid-binding Zn ribbon protein